MRGRFYRHGEEILQYHRVDRTAANSEKSGSGSQQRADSDSGCRGMDVFCFDTLFHQSIQQGPHRLYQKKAGLDYAYGFLLRKLREKKLEEIGARNAAQGGPELADELEENGYDKYLGL